ncbi:MAG TPA: hypothetical protein VLK35_08215 [Methylomirabilota bacterium]|nr:hypothetical protein [Methylomirabilota bacterium]
MEALEQLRGAIPDAAKDIRLNLQAVLRGGALTGYEMCVRAHEKTVTDGGLTPDHVNDAVRIAATIHGAAVALEAGAESPALAGA